jgi:hypothetical protein
LYLFFEYTFNELTPSLHSAEDLPLSTFLPLPKGELKKSKSINPAYRQADAKVAKAFRQDRKEQNYNTLTLSPLQQL